MFLFTLPLLSSYLLVLSSRVYCLSSLLHYWVHCQTFGVGNLFYWYQFSSLVYQYLCYYLMHGKDKIFVAPSLSLSLPLSLPQVIFYCHCCFWYIFCHILHCLCICCRLYYRKAEELLIWLSELDSPNNKCTLTNNDNTEQLPYNIWKRVGSVWGFTCLPVSHALVGNHVYVPHICHHWIILLFIYFSISSLF